MRMLPTVLMLSLCAARAQTPLEGVVKETTNTTTYTYVLLSRPEGEAWLAGPRTPLKVGDRIRTAPGMMMKEFASPSLKRTFPEIWFVGAIRPAGAAQADASAALPPGHPPLPGAGPASPHAQVQGAPPGVNPAPVAKAPGGLTVAEIHAQSAALAGKTVIVRGRVVKANRNVLQRNWLHLRDGTGAPGSDDLTVTTDAVAAVGEVVTVQGKLAVNRDFGSGYKYAVLLEESVKVPESPTP